MNATRRLAAIVVLNASIVAATIAGATTASAGPVPGPDEAPACMPGYDFQPLHCDRLIPYELGAPLGFWFDNLAKKASGLR